MPLYPSPVKVVAYSHQERTITVMDGRGGRITWEFDINQNYEEILTRVFKCIKGGFQNGAWAALRKGKEVNPIYGPRNWSPRIIETVYGICVNIKSGKKEALVAKHDTKTEPDKDYRFTAIAPTAQSLTYHGKRQWFKTAAACSKFCEEVFAGEAPRSFVLAIVEAHQLIEPTKKVDVTVTKLKR